MEDERPSFEKLKTMVTVPEVCELLGVEVSSSGKFTSPYNPDERTPSAHAYEDHFFDYSTGNGGDVVDLVQALQPDLSASRILYLLWNKALKVGKVLGSVEHQQPRVLDIEKLTSLWVSRKSGRLEEWEDHLGVKLVHRTVVKAVDGVLWVGHVNESGVYGIKYRDMTGRKWSEPGSQFTHRLYHPGRWVFERKPDAIICEGESDCWAMDYRLGHKADVFALPSGASSWKDHWRADLEPYRTVWLAMDNDHAGQQARQKLTLKIGYEQVKELRVPQLYNDVRVAIRAGWIPRLET